MNNRFMNVNEQSFAGKFFRAKGALPSPVATVLYTGHQFYLSPAFRDEGNGGKDTVLVITSITVFSLFSF